jgi:uncharacterized protein (DUF2141 family)
MIHASRPLFTILAGALAIAWPLAAAGPQGRGGGAVPPVPPVPPAAQAIREQIVAIDAASGRGSVVLPISSVSLTGTGIIVGQIVDAGSGAPVGNAIVTLGGTTPPAPVAMSPGRAAAPGPAGAPGGAPGTGRAAAPAPTILRQLTDADGRFAFRHLPRGAYSVSATRPGYVDGAYGRLRPTGAPQPLELADGERRSDIKVRVFKYAAITGMLREENGDPAVGVNVRAYRRTVVAGRQQLAATFVVQTDDRGVYRLGNLTPGEYVVAVPFASSTAPAVMGATSSDLQATMFLPGSAGTPLGSGSIVPQSDRFVLNSAGLAYGAVLDATGAILVTPTTYFPSALVASQAQPITLGSGEERAGVDIMLRSMPSTFIAGRLMGPDGPAANWALHLVASDTGDLTTDPQVASAITDADGSFMFLGVPAGSYVIQTVRTNPGGGPVSPALINGQPIVVTSPPGAPATAQVVVPPTLWTATPITVGPEGLRDLGVTLRAGLRVSGRVEFDGSSERPPATRLQTVTVLLDPADGRQRAAMAPARLDGSGQFMTVGHLPGRYVVRVTNPPGGWTLKSVMLGGTDVSDMPLELDARDVSGLVVTFVDRSTDLQGAVRDPQGKPDRDAAVGVFPLDNRLWTNAGSVSRRMRMTRTTSAGTFSFAGLPPGEYGVTAFSEEFAGDWPDARFIEQLSRSATRVTLLEGGKQSLDLSRQPLRGGLAKNTSGMFFGPEKNMSGMFFEADSRESAVSGPNFPDSESSESAEFEKHTRRVFQQRDVRVEPATAAASAATVSGTVTEDATNQPVRRARVSVRGADARLDRAVLTDDAGRFAVTSLPAGQYSIQVTKPGYLTGYHGAKRPGRGPGTALKMTAGQKAQVSIRMARGGVITGIVRDESGAPLPNARVAAGIVRYTGGMRDISQVSGAQTDDRGMYRIFGLPPNNYYVFAIPSISPLDVRQLTSDDWQTVTSELRQTVASTGAPGAATAARAPSGRPVAYAPVFYPGTMTSSDATPITLAAAQEVSSIDLSVRLVPTARIEGTVSTTDGRPMAGALLMMFPQDIATGFTTSITTQQDGRFATPFVPPGRYTIFARGNLGNVQRDGVGITEGRVMQVFPAIAAPPGAPPPPPPPPPPPVPPGQSNLFAEQAFDLSGESIAGVSLVVQEGVTVSGRIQFEGQRPPAAGAEPTVRLSTPTAMPMRFSFGTPTATSQAGGMFSIIGVPPGKVRFAAQAISNVQGPNQPPMPAAAGWMLKSAIVNGRDALDLPLDITLGRNIEGAVLTFTDRMADLSGAVLDGAGAPNGDLLIMLLPADRTYWEMPSSRRFRAPVTPGIDGRYLFTNLPAGDYLLVALADADGLDFSDRNILEQLAAGAIKITIAEGEKKTQDIRTR